MPYKEMQINRQGIFVMFSIFVILFSSQLVLSQKVESVYMSEFDSGITIYTITNRPYEKSGEDVRFLNDVSSDTVLTFLKISFYQPDSLHITIMKQEDFIRETSLLQDDWLLFVHGDSKTFEQAVMRGFDIQHLYNVHVLVFSWPSKDPEFNGIKNFKNSKQNVVRSLDHFTTLLHFVNKFKKSNPSFSESAKLSMFIHSLGNAYLENLVKQHPPINIKDTLFNNLIINAAAVNQEDHKLWVEQLNFQTHIYIINNKQDFNLKGVRIFTKDGKQLGEVIDQPVADNANYVQFTEAVGFRTPTGTTHTYFIGEVADESLNIRNFYKEIFHGQQPNLMNDSNFVKRDDGVGFDINF
jgi:esterase/lipase superfamily enzyme